MSSRSLVPAIGRCRSCSLAGGLAKRALWVFRNAGRNAFAASMVLMPASPALTSTITHCAREGADGQAVVCPLLRGRSPPRGVAPKQQEGSGVLSLRHFGRDPFIPWQRGCRRIWRGVI